MTRIETVALIKKVAATVGVDPVLLQAIATVESSLISEAVKFEPLYRWHHEPVTWALKIRQSVPGYSAETERALQSFSYGLIQVMGAVMREQGFTGHLQTVLANPEICLEYGARHLKKFLTRYKGNVGDAICAYNRGSAKRLPNGEYANQHYVNKVTLEMQKISRSV